MNLAPLWAAASPIPMHAILGLITVVLGIIQLGSPKGTMLHKITGRLWVAAMAIVAFSGFFIHELQMLGPLSPIHIISAVMLYYLFIGVRAARQGNIRLHRTVMRCLFWFGLVITGWFTLLPGRTMYTVIFGT